MEWTKIRRRFSIYAAVAELADARDLKSYVVSFGEISANAVPKRISEQAKIESKSWSAVLSVVFIAQL